MSLYFKAGGRSHRFLGYFKRPVEGIPCYIYRCVCGYIEADPVVGGPGYALDGHFKPRPDARNIAVHAPLERSHQAN